MSKRAKAFEAKCAVEDGADEIDMVIHIGALKDGDFQAVEEDIRAVVEASAPALVKVIVETCLLTKEEIKKACRLSEQAGAAFLKSKNDTLILLLKESERGSEYRFYHYIFLCIRTSLYSSL